MQALFAEWGTFVYFGYDFSTKLRAFSRGVMIIFFNFIYRKVAYRLTTLENYRTQSKFESSLIMKIVLFELVNSYNAIIYVAFFKSHTTGCMNHEYVYTDECFGELSTEVAIVYLTLMLRKVFFIVKMWYDSRKSPNYTEEPME